MLAKCKKWISLAYMLELNTLSIIIIAIMGACFGSFITAASYRLPREEDAIAGASKCPKCGSKLKVLDLIPILSWFFSGGKCRYCKVKISPRYVITEIITTLLFVFLVLKFGLTVKFIIFALLTVALLIMIISDFETYIMPDSTTIAALVLAAAYHYFNADLWQDFLLGFAACLLVALLLRYGFYLITKREGLGMGDVKFLPVAGLWIGQSSLPLYFIIAGLTGIITAIIWRVVYKKIEYPFGPALAIAMYVMALFPQINNSLPILATKITQLGIF